MGMEGEYKEASHKKNDLKWLLLVQVGRALSYALKECRCWDEASSHSQMTLRRNKYTIVMLWGSRTTC